MAQRSALLLLLLPTPALAGGSLPVVENNSGAFTYTVPLDVPGGPGEVTPSLALLYSSATGSGNAGFGWQLPYSSIELDLRSGAPWWWYRGSDLCDVH